MEKFFKSIFSNSDKRRNSKCDGSTEDEKNDFSPPLDDRRKLSISRSGRMKANKKRQSLSLEVFGTENQMKEKPKSVEYHVNSTNKNSAHRRISVEELGSKDQNSETKVSKTQTTKLGPAPTESRSPEEEIESAFQIIDKAL